MLIEDEREGEEEAWHSLGQSVRGVERLSALSKVPAHASRFVRKGPGKLNSFFTVAGMDECSNCEVGVGPFGVCITANHKLMQFRQRWATRMLTLQHVVHLYG